MLGHDALLAHGAASKHVKEEEFAFVCLSVCLSVCLATRFITKHDTWLENKIKMRIFQVIYFLL